MALGEMVVGGEAVAVVPLVDRQRMKVGADRHGRAQLLADLHGTAAGQDRVVEAVDEVVLGGHQFHQFGFGLTGEQTAVLERDLEELARLGVGTGTRGRAGRIDCRRRDQSRVAGPDARDG